MTESNSFSNGPGAGNSTWNGPDPEPLLHPWFCACSWCVQGVK